MPVWALKCRFCPLKCRFWGLKFQFCPKKEDITYEEKKINISRKGSRAVPQIILIYDPWISAPPPAFRGSCLDVFYVVQVLNFAANAFFFPDSEGSRGSSCSGGHCQAPNQNTSATRRCFTNVLYSNQKFSSCSTSEDVTKGTSFPTCFGQINTITMNPNPIQFEDSRPLFRGTFLESSKKPVEQKVSDSPP